MTTLPPPDAPAVFWIDQNSQQQGPEPLTTVIERIAYNQIPATTPVWWQGAANWTTFNTVPEFAAALQARLAPAPATPAEAASPAESAPASEAAPTAESSFTTPETFAVGAESPGTEASIGEVGAAASALTATELIAQAGATGGEATEGPGELYGASFDDASAGEEPETTRLFDATNDQAIEAEPSAEVAAPESYLSGTAGAIDVGDDVVDAFVVDDSGDVLEAGTGTATIEPVASPTFDAPDLQPVTLEPITLGSGATAGAAEGTGSGYGAADDVIESSIGATEDLDAVYAELVASAQPYVDEQTRVAALNDTLASLLTRALTALGHSVNSHQESNGYHVFALQDPQGAPFSLAATQIPYAASVAEAIERPVGVHVDRGGRASAYLYLGDYLDRGEEGDSLFGRHIAAIIHAASR